MTFGALAPPLTISAEDPRVGAALLESVGPQVVELSQALHGTLGEGGSLDHHMAS